MQHSDGQRLLDRFRKQEKNKIAKWNHRKLFELFGWQEKEEGGRSYVSLLALLAFPVEKHLPLPYRYCS